MGSKLSKTIYVGMSGGVDSSVSAALLKKQGYNVVGVFIKAWEPAGWDCGWREDRRDAMRVAAVLDIPFLTLDLSQEYKKEVVDYMIAEYQAGRTPNPDVMCNKAIKFGAFFKRARAAGADYVATGHYARVQELNGKDNLLMGLDKNKDQTYFLWTLKQEQLVHTLFPIGQLEKTAVRDLAASFALPVAQKKDSQGLCFMGKLDVKDFLREFIKTEKGAVLNSAGEIVGEHDGVLLYTLGERHGFRLFHHEPNSKPVYIICKDLIHNTLTIAPETETADHATAELVLREVNWISTLPEPTKEYQIRVRYRQDLQPAWLHLNQNKQWQVRLTTPQLAAAGQSLVVYDGEICLGGGIIA